MNKKFTFLVVITILVINVSCSNKKEDNSGFDVKFKTIKGDDCHNCFGKLVVSKGSLVDTIKGGQWGKNVDYQTLKINSKEYLFTSFSYSYPMGERCNEYKIYSLESTTFMKKLFEKAITEYKENNQTENEVSINYIMSREIKVSLKDSIGFFIKMKVKKCPEIEGVDCVTIFEDTSLEYYSY
jgi:hypothetical protein